MQIRPRTVPFSLEISTYLKDLTKKDLIKLVHILVCFLRLLARCTALYLVEALDLGAKPLGTWEELEVAEVVILRWLLSG